MHYEITKKYYDKLLNFLVRHLTCLKLYSCVYINIVCFYISTLLEDNKKENFN